MPEGPWPGGSYYLLEVPAEEAEPEPPERPREPSARTLERVAPIAQKRTVGEVTVALSSLEACGEGLGVVRWRVSMERGAFRREPDFGFGIPEPEFEIRDDAGRVLPWSPRGSGASDGESDGEVEVRDPPEAGGLEAVVPRLVADAYGEYQGEGPSYDGPWTFSFST